MLFDTILVVAVLGRDQVEDAFNIWINLVNGSDLDVEVVLTVSHDFSLASNIEVSIEIADFEIILFRVSGEIDLVIPDADLDTIIIDA